MLLLLAIGLQLTSLLIGILHRITTTLYGDVTTVYIPITIETVSDTAPATSSTLTEAIDFTEDLIKRLSDDDNPPCTLLSTYNFSPVLNAILHILKAIDQWHDDVGESIVESCATVDCILLEWECPFNAATTCTSHQTLLHSTATWDFALQGFPLIEQQFLQLHYQHRLLFQAVQVMQDTLSFSLPLVDNRVELKSSVHNAIMCSLLDKGRRKRLQETVRLLFAYLSTVSTQVGSIVAHSEAIQNDVLHVRGALVLAAFGIPMQGERNDLTLIAREACRRLRRG